jgi:hypothetical protein
MLNQNNMSIKLHNEVVIDALKAGMLKMRDATASNSDWLEAFASQPATFKALNCTINGAQFSRTTHSSTFLFSLPVAMTSRRLAFSLNQALRSKQALRSIQPLKRNFATPVEPARTECTTLSNGLTVAFTF